MEVIDTVNVLFGVVQMREDSHALLVSFSYKATPKCMFTVSIARKRHLANTRGRKVACHIHLNRLQELRKLLYCETLA